MKKLVPLPRKIVTMSETDYPRRGFSEIIEARSLLSSFLSDYEHDEVFAEALRSMLTMLSWMLGDDRDSQPLVKLINGLREMSQRQKAQLN